MTCIRHFPQFRQTSAFHPSSPNPLEPISRPNPSPEAPFNAPFNAGVVSRFVCLVAFCRCAVISILTALSTLVARIVARFPSHQEHRWTPWFMLSPSSSLQERHFQVRSAIGVQFFVVLRFRDQQRCDDVTPCYSLSGIEFEEYTTLITHVRARNIITSIPLSSVPGAFRSTDYFQVRRVRYLY